MINSTPNNLFINFDLRRSRYYFAIALLSVYLIYLFSTYVFKQKYVTSEYNSSSESEIEDLEHELNDSINLQLILKRNQSFSSLLKTNNISVNDVAQLCKELRVKNLINKIRPESKIHLNLVQDDIQNKKMQIIDATIYTPDHLCAIQIKKNSTGFDIQKLMIDLSKSIVKVKTKIGNGLFTSLKSLNIPLNAITEITNAYSHKIDFQRNIKNGDEIELLIEQYHKSDNDFSHYGNIILSKLNLSNAKHELYRFSHASGTHSYYCSDGKSFKQNLLKTPVKAARISSHFGKRKHPILGYTKMHKGIDFAASHGTPIYCAGDGIITEISRSGGYGNYMKIKHSGQLSTLYAHISRFNPELKVGQRVKQGKTIAYVGSTGSATGPHLHYETLVDGRQVDPLSIKTLSHNLLEKKELETFIAYKNQLNDIDKFLDSNTVYQVNQSI